MLQPLSNRVLVKPIENSGYSKGGIFIDKPKSEFQRSGDQKYVQRCVGEVMAVGPGKYGKKGLRRKPDVAIGSMVSFSDSCGHAVEYEGENYIFIREDDIMFLMDDKTDVYLEDESWKYES